MRERLSTLRPPLAAARVQYAGDAAIAFLLALSAVGAVASGDPAFGRPTTLGVTLALCSTLPLVARRRWPLLVAGVLLVANAADLAAAAPHETGLQPFIALVLAGYSLGSLGEGRLSAAGPAVLAVLALGLFAAASIEHQHTGNAIASYVWLVTAWGVGRVVRRMRTKTRELEIANAALAEHRERAAEVAVALERGRIAREIHDVIAHNVSMMVVQATAAARVLEAEEPQVRKALDVVAETGRQTVDEMRSLLGVLRSSDPETADRTPQPGLADLGALAERLGRSGIPVSWRIEGACRPLPRALDLSAYRIVQEALTNSMRHAPGSHADVVVRFGEGVLALDIKDAGGTRNGEGLPGGHGLVGMRERAALFGGQVTTASTPDGFRVSATLPLPAGGTS